MGVLDHNMDGVFTDSEPHFTCRDLSVKPIFDSPRGICTVPWTKYSLRNKVWGSVLRGVETYPFRRVKEGGWGLGRIRLGVRMSLLFLLFEPDWWLEDSSLRWRVTFYVEHFSRERPEEYCTFVDTFLCPLKGKLNCRFVNKEILR